MEFLEQLKAEGQNPIALQNRPDIGWPEAQALDCFDHTFTGECCHLTDIQAFCDIAGVHDPDRMMRLVKGLETVVMMHRSEEMKKAHSRSASRSSSKGK